MANGRARSSVAISASGEAAGIAGSDAATAGSAAGAASFAGGERCLQRGDLGLVQRTRRVGRRRCGLALLRIIQWRRTFRDRRFGLAESAAVHPALSAAVFRFSRFGDGYRVASGVACPAGSAGAAAAGTSADGFSTTGSSLRSFPRLRLDRKHRQHRPCGFVLLRKYRFRAARATAGLLANSSWAARSSAAAPSPKTSIDIDSRIAANRKRKPGSIGANSAFAWVLRRPLSHRERGDHRIGRVRGARRCRAQRIRLNSRIPQRFPRRLLKIGANNARRPCRSAFSGPVRLGCNGACRSITNTGIRRELAGFVLNAPLSSAICR